jgi:hypothetical protein
MESRPGAWPPDCRPPVQTKPATDCIKANHPLPGLQQHTLCAVSHMHSRSHQRAPQCLASSPLHPPFSRTHTCTSSLPTSVLACPEIHWVSQLLFTQAMTSSCKPKQASAVRISHHSQAQQAAIFMACNAAVCLSTAALASLVCTGWR